MLEAKPIRAHHEPSHLSSVEEHLYTATWPANLPLSLTMEQATQKWGISLLLAS